METTTKAGLSHAVIHSGAPETAGYQPIIIGPGTGAGGHGHKAKIAGDAMTMSLNISSGNPNHSGTTNLEIQFFGINEDASGNISLVDDITQIPEQNPSGGNNRKQSLSITNQNQTAVSVYIVPDSTEVAVMAIARPVAGGPSGNVGVYFFDIV
jgi:hypothetical protein